MPVKYMNNLVEDYEEKTEQVKIETLRSDDITNEQFNEMLNNESDKEKIFEIKL